MKIYLFKKNQKKIKGSMAINSFKKTMEKTILNMKCIVMVIFSYILWDWGEVYTVYWELGRVFFFFVFKLCFLVAMENVFERNCDIWWDSFFVFFPQMPLFKRDSLQCPGALNWQRCDENETLTERGEGSGSCTVPSYVNIHTLHWGVSPKAISWKWILFIIVLYRTQP